MATKLDRHEVIYDLEDGIGWLMGSVVVLFARPMIWLIFRDWEEDTERIRKKLRR